MFYRLGKKNEKTLQGVGGEGHHKPKLVLKKKNQHWNRVIKDSGLFASDQK